jgi:hypothetical protein
MILREHPTLAENLVSATVSNAKVPLWAALPTPQTADVTLLDSESNYANWKAVDAFPGLECLGVEMIGTRELLSWPLRELKQIRLTNCVFNLDSDSFDAIRELVRKRELKVHDGGAVFGLDQGGRGAVEMESRSRLLENV